MPRARSTRNTLILCLLIGSGCATARPPRELDEARRAYERAAASEAPALVPAELEAARPALLRAEDARAEDARSDVTRTLGYVAARKAERAEALAGALAAEQKRKETQ